jgi:hypothetical protein
VKKRFFSRFILPPPPKWSFVLHLALKLKKTKIFKHENGTKKTNLQDKTGQETKLFPGQNGTKKINLQDKTGQKR